MRGLASLANLIVLLVALERAIVDVVLAASPRADVPGVGHGYARKWSGKMRTLRREEEGPCVGRWWWVFRWLV